MLFDPCNLRYALRVLIGISCAAMLMPAIGKSAAGATTADSHSRHSEELHLAPAQPGIVTGRTTVTADIRIHGDLVPWTPVTFALDGIGTLEITQTQTGSTGRAATIFVPPIGQSGTSTITATAVLDGETITDLLTINYEGRGYYTIVDLGNPDNVITSTVVFSFSMAYTGPGLNNHGEVVFRQHIMRADQAPEPLAAFNFTGYNITDSGVVLGAAQFPTLGLSAAYLEDGVVHRLPNLEPTTAGPGAAYAMNAQGTIAGYSLMRVFVVPPSEQDPGGYATASHATIWNGGAPSALIRPRPTLYLAMEETSRAHDINDAGLVVGRYETQATDGSSEYDYDRLGRLWYGGGSYTRLPNIGPLPYIFSIGVAINNHNAIAGWAHARPVLWLLSPAHGLPAGMHILSDEIGGAYDINEAGEVVGIMHLPENRTYGFHWANGEFKNLNDLIDPDSLYNILEAARINENGQIVCWANLKSDPQSFAVLLLTPQDRWEEP